MDVTDIIISPLITEKTHVLKNSEVPRLSFIVHKDANKTEIKKAFKSIFGYTALAVNTLIKKPQPTRITQRSRKNFSKLFKVAYITISKTDLLDMQKSVEEVK